VNISPIYDERNRLQLFLCNLDFPIGALLTGRSWFDGGRPFSLYYGMSNKTFTLSDDLHQYLLSMMAPEADVLRRLREETALLPNHSMQIAPEQGRFMQLLLHILGARETIEVGVFTGYSALCTALALPPGGKIVACDRNREWTDIAQKYWREAGVEKKIDLRIGEATGTLDALIRDKGTGRYDFVFVDADKNNYWEYFERSLLLLRKGGLLAVDNVLWSGRVVDPETTDADAKSIRVFNERLKNDPRVQLSVVPIADGLTLALKL